jgi:hypothetical protein
LSTDVSEVRTASIIRDDHFTRQYIPEGNSEYHTRRRENLKSHLKTVVRGVKFKTYDDEITAVRTYLHEQEARNGTDRTNTHVFLVGARL